MDATASLLSVDNDSAVLDVATRHLRDDPRLTLRLADGEAFLKEHSGPFDLIFADTWAGKFHHLDEALNLVKPGGIYVVDDLLPQPNWPDDHPPKVERLVNELRGRTDFVSVCLGWSSGLMMLMRRW
jgi:predicted O-methyltransferase YrrM